MLHLAFNLLCLTPLGFWHYLVLLLLAECGWLRKEGREVGPTEEIEEREKLKPVLGETL
jgi:hypothetical protein